MDKSVISRAVTVAAGRFAPGHLGELTQQVPFKAARRRERRGSYPTLRLLALVSRGTRTVVDALFRPVSDGET